jgi:predicted Zn-dependent peptidase
VKKFILENGLRVVTEAIPTCRSVAFGIWVRTGSRNEDPINNGISHFIEHMLFKGTEQYSAKDIADVFDGIGGNVNAFTSKEYTCYYAKVLDQHLPTAMEVLADMFFRSLFEEQEMNKEKNVILEEISMYEDTPDDLVHDLVSRAAYGDHPLAYSILGLEDRLKAMGPNDLRTYMKQHYLIENTVISIAGNIDDDVMDLVRQYFSGFDQHGDTSIIHLPSYQGGLVYHNKKTEQNHICLSMPGYQIDDEHIYAMVLVNNVIGGGMSSRLFQEIREKRGLAYSVYSYHSSHTDSGLFTIYAGTAPGQTEEVLKVTMELLADIKGKGITEAELVRGKEQLKGSLILSLESTSSRMNRMGKNEMLLGRHYSLDALIEKIESVSMEQLRTVTSTIFSQPISLAMVGSSDKAIKGFRRDSLVI